MVHSLRHWASFFVGAIIFCLGFFPLIGKSAWLGPISNSVILVIGQYIVAIGGLYIIIDSFFEFTFHSGLGIATLIVGLIVFALGLVTILHDMGQISFHIGFLNAIVYQILFILEGLFLMIGCFVMD